MYIDNGNADPGARTLSLQQGATDPASPWRRSNGCSTVALDAASFTWKLRLNYKPFSSHHHSFHAALGSFMRKFTGTEWLC